MKLQKFSSTLLSKTLIADDVYEITLTKPGDFAFAAGQYVLFDVPLIDNAADIQTRAYSVASAPQEEHLRFIIKCLPSGRASNWIREKFAPGDTLNFQGPIGRFTWKPIPSSEAVFVATGTGLAPFMSMLREGIEPATSVHLLFGVRNEADLFCLDELHALFHDLPHRKLTVTLSCPETKPGHESGRVLKHLATALSETSVVYLCGNPDMVKEAKQLCLNHGLAKERIHTEAFI